MIKITPIGITSPMALDRILFSDDGKTTPTKEREITVTLFLRETPAKINWNFPRDPRPRSELFAEHNA